MGVVYIVHDHNWGIPLAVKQLQTEIVDKVQGIAERFTKEAELWIALDSHPNIVQAILVKNVQGSPLIFLEYVERDLASYIGGSELLGNIPLTLRGCRILAISSSWNRRSGRQFCTVLKIQAPVIPMGAVPSLVLRRVRVLTLLPLFVRHTLRRE
jgi:serine/threonine protein kinase